MRGAPSYEKKPCKHCHEQIGVNAIERHEAICKASTEEERAARRKYRLAGRQFRGYDQPPALREAKAAQRAKQNGHAAQDLAHDLAAFRQQRFSVTFSIGWEALQALLVSLGPTFVIDDVQVLQE
jgi:hypothetical protein